MFPSYENAIKAACNFLIATQTGSLPIDPFQTIENQGWILVPYTDFAHQKQIYLSRLITLMGSEDSVTLYDVEEDQYYICYNDTKPIERIRFTLAHEIGHIVQRHFLIPGVTALNFSNNLLIHGDANKPLEQEANTFAANFLSPAPLFRIFNLETTDIQRIFKISAESACYRQQYARYDANKIPRSISSLILEMFTPSLRKLIFSMQ